MQSLNNQCKKKMKLGLFMLAPGHHIAAWRHPDSRADGVLNLEYYTQIARTAEKGKFDMIFLSDAVGIRTHYKDAEELSHWGYMVHFEPLTILAALAALTKNIGLAATASTTYNEPFHIARKFASIDFISKGRAAWNVVTSGTDVEAKNMNLDKQPDHSTRYRRAREFMQVVTGLWDSWEDDAFLFDKSAGKYFDPKKLHTINHKGEFFSVKGPLNVARPPQGYPVIIQAGASDDGKDFAAQWAEVIFTAHQTLEQAQKFYRDIKSQAATYNKDPENTIIMPGVFPVIGKSYSEAKEKYESYQELIDQKVGLGLLSGLLGDVIDLSLCNLDEKLPPISITNGNTSRQKLIYEKALRENLTIRELYKSIAGARGHRMIFGTPTDIVDQLEEWFFKEGADGFNIMPPCLPTSLDDFVNLVIPELQKRNLFRTEYEGMTLRENLGIPKPLNQHIL